MSSPHLLVVWLVLFRAFFPFFLLLLLSLLVGFAVLFYFSCFIFFLDFLLLSMFFPYLSLFTLFFFIMESLVLSVLFYLVQFVCFLIFGGVRYLVVYFYQYRRIFYRVSPSLRFPRLLQCGIYYRLLRDLSRKSII